MSDVAEELAKGVKSDRALRLINTVLLMAVLSGVGLVVNYVMADHELLAEMRERQRATQVDMAALRSDLEKVRDGEWLLDRRVTTIEAKVK